MYVKKGGDEKIPTMQTKKPKKKPVLSATNIAASEAYDQVVAKSNTLLSSDDELTMYYYDAYYEKFAEDATVYLFGKAIMGTSTESRKSVSVCLAVENMERNVYVYPRKYFQEDPNDPSTITDREVGFGDVYKELKAVFKRMGVKKWYSKKVERKFCFEQPYVKKIGNEESGDFKSMPSVPGEASFLKVLYSFKYPALPRNLKGRTFEFVFGTGSSQMELLLLKRELMGPCWIKVKKPVRRSNSDCVSWCKYEFTVDSHKKISKLPNPQPPSPPFSMLCLSLKTRLNAKTHTNEVAMASLKYLPSMNIDSPLHSTWSKDCKSVVTACKLENRGWPYDLPREELKSKMRIVRHANERALLNFTTNKIHAWDPDIIVSHDLHGFVIDVLMNRMQFHKVQYWSRIGRLKKSRMPKAARGGLSLVDFGVGCGRLMVDTQTSAKELVRENTYTLTHLSKSILDTHHKEIESAKVEFAYARGEDLVNLVKHTQQDGDLTIKLLDRLQIVPLTKQLTNIGGNLWSRSLRSARAERVEYLLLHRFHGMKYIVPEKLTSKEKKEKIAAKNRELGIVDTGKGKKRKKPKYEGGLVLEPKKGFYDKYVLLLDFNSLYPSIILEFDLCFTTVKHWEPKKAGEMVDLPMREANHKGTLPNVIKQLLSRRKVVKELMKKERNAVQKRKLDIRQKAIKLVANSMYGCLGFSSSRFFCQPIAALITSQGRSILEKTKQLAETSLGMEVIYGDTDSIMIYTDSDNYPEVQKMGRRVKQEVNKLYRDLTIDIDGVFKKMLLLRKKKYAALTIAPNPDGLLEAHKETKGLDLVRRDWSAISKSVGNFVLDRILSDASREEVVDKILGHLEEVREDIKNGKIPLGRFAITKGLTKHPNDYPDAKSQPHVMVAKRMLAQDDPVRVGMHIPYIVCEGEGGVAQRAYHVKEVRKSKGKLKVDNKWYFANQLFPPIARLCAPIKEIPAAALANALGLDGKKYTNYDKDDTAADDAVLNVVASIHDDKERFKNCASLKVPCACGVHKKFTGIFDFETGKSGFECATRNCSGLVTAVGQVNAVNTICREARKHITQYYDGWLECGNQVCRKVTRTLPLGSAKCCSCYEPLHRKYSESELYTQLSYYLSLFDLERAKKNLETENKRRADAGLEELKMELTAEQEQICKDIHSFISDKYVKMSGYNYINLGNLFSPLFA